MATNTGAVAPKPYDPRVVAYALAITAFLALAVLAIVSDTSPGDVWLTRQLQSVDFAPFTQALDLTEDAAQFPGYIIAISLAALLFVACGRLRPSAFLLAVPATALLVPTLKPVIARPRPDSALVDVVFPQPDSMSFPSGHAFTAVIVYGLIFCLAAAYIPARWLRITLQTACVWVIVLTSIERVYVGHHWPSDVLGGILLGAIVLAAVVVIERSTARTRLADAAEPVTLAQAPPRG